jgi:hypothetical protein
MRSLNRYVTAVLLCCALTLPLVAQQVDENNWGKNTVGVELGTHEAPREHTATGTVLVYNILGKGFPADKDYDLWFWIPGKKPQKGIEGVSFDKRGLVVCSGKPGACKGAGPEDPINIKTKALLGEPKRFAVVSRDGKIAGFAEAVPFPIEATDKKCKLTVIRQSPLAELVAVRASGFTPYEMLTVTGHLGAADSVHSPSASADGTWQAIVGTRPPGQVSGVASIKVAGKSCSVGVSFD